MARSLRYQDAVGDVAAACRPVERRPVNARGRARLTTAGRGAGTMAGLSFSPRYAAPEVLAAYEARQPQINVKPSMDIWSLGVMAYELLTDEPAFDRFCKQPEMIDRILGRQPLPWEEPAKKDKGLRKLRMLKRSIMKCLSRVPEERPTATELLESWENLFDSFGQEQTQVAA